MTKTEPRRKQSTDRKEKENAWRSIGRKGIKRNSLDFDAKQRDKGDKARETRRSELTSARTILRVGVNLAPLNSKDEGERRGAPVRSTEQPYPLVNTTTEERRAAAPRSHVPRRYLSHNLVPSFVTLLAMVNLRWVMSEFRPPLGIQTGELAKQVCPSTHSLKPTHPARVQSE